MINYKSLILIALTGILVLVTFLAPPVPQELSYHHFADSRMWHGIPKFLNVVSNLPFFLIGTVGIYEAYRQCQRSVAAKPGFRLSWLFVFIGVVLVSLGSAFYHWKPDNSSLVWDRLPMTIVFMSFAAIIVSERMPFLSVIPVLCTLLTAGIFSVLYWYFTEQQQAGDLRPYVFVQFAPMLILPALLMLYRQGPRLFPELAFVFLFYVLAKLLEFFDSGIFHLIGFMSGHTLKHLAAAVATIFMLILLKKRAREADNL